MSTVIDWDQVDERYSPLLETEWFKERPKEIQDAFRKYPPWHFYTNADGSLPRRLWGFAEFYDSDNKLVIRAHAVTAMLMWINEPPGCVPLDDLVRVYEWTPEFVSKFKLLQNPNAFLEPDGFSVFCVD